MLLSVNGSDEDEPVSGLGIISVSEALDEAPDHASVQQRVRLCALRLQKVEQQWGRLYAKVNTEYACLDMASCEDDEVEEFPFSMVIEEAVAFCGSIKALMCSSYSSGPWTTIMAVQDFFWESFGKLEGEDSVIRHMQELGIALGPSTRPILEIALKILVNGRCDDTDYELDRL